MNIFRKFEKKLEKIFEGTFSRALRTKIEPIEIAHWLEKAMEDSTVEGLKTTFTANIYRIQVNPKDYTLLKPFFSELISELENFVRERATERGVVIPGRVQITAEKSDRIKIGEIKVIPEIRKDEVEEMIEEERNLEKTQLVTPNFANETGLYHSPYYFEELSSGKRHYVSRFPVRIGRIDSNDVRIDDLSVSRVHAEVYREGSALFIRDLESTNGTRVNGKKVRQKKLNQGDIVVVGETKLRWVVIE